MTPIRVIGIDLGTSKCAAAEVLLSQGQRPEAQLIPVEQATLSGIAAQTFLPSQVALFEGQVFTGEGAKRLREEPRFYPLPGENLFYDSKNDMGLGHIYPKAPEGFRSPADIAGRFLSTLYSAALVHRAEAIARTVITVPASFRANQRAETLRAARLAGLELGSGDLLDEPVAAFLGYLNGGGLQELDLTAKPKTLVVFDFGGGTCDIAVLRISMGTGPAPFRISPLSISQYHRLGGGDIDLAIVYEVLIPALSRQNKLNPAEIGYHEKKRRLEPALLNVAETLKIGLCSHPEEPVQRLNQRILCNFNHGNAWLSQPSLSREQFDSLLAPFLDPALLVPRETEYRMTCSIFAPLEDALDRAGVTADKVDFCLLAGGSSLIPQVARAVAGFFPAAKVLKFSNAEEAQSAVARGAAWHGLSLAQTGKGLVTPVCHEGISIETESGPVEIVPAHSELPFPKGKASAVFKRLSVPGGSFAEAQQLKVSLVASGDLRPLYNALWDLSARVVEVGEELRLTYRCDANQMLHLHLTLADRPADGGFEAVIEYPLTPVSVTGRYREEILKIETELATLPMPPLQKSECLAKLANLHGELGHREKALDLLKRALRTRETPDPWLILKMSDLYGEMGQTELKEKMCREAAQWPGAGSAPFFNLALSQYNRGDLEQALVSVGLALRADRDPAYMVLKGLILIKSGKEKEGTDLLRQSLPLFDPLRQQMDWELYWYKSAARQVGESALVQQADDERARRAREKAAPPPSSDDPAVLPALLAEERKTREMPKVG